MQRVKRSYFTLLELFVVLFIISLGVILTGVKVKEMYQQQRFLSESQQVVSHLAMAQDLMLIMDADVVMKIVKDPKSRHFTFWLEVDKPLEEKWARFIERKIELSTIQFCEFQGREEDELALHFSLGRMSKGTLVLFEGKKDHSEEPLRIELPGYPCPLSAKSSFDKEENKAEISEDLYPADVKTKLYENSSKKDPTP